MTSVQDFSTARLTVQDWAPVITEPEQRQVLETALTKVLTPVVLAHLPPPLQLTDDADAISAWIDARARESQVCLVTMAAETEVVGLLILASDVETDAEPTLHIGYLLAETAWGQGIATELVAGLVTALEGQGPLALIGGVGRENLASAKVLQKAGFQRDPDRSDEETDMFVRRLP